jgi:predicted ATPase/DNA-binding SARP family transcriptional activator
MREQGSRLRVNLFGQPSLLAGDVVRPLPARERALSLLAYLALHPGPQQREHVAFALLPDEEESSALASLRRQLLFIKKIIPIDDGRWLKAAFRTIGWDEDASVDCDLRLYDRLHGSAEEQAVELYAGDLLPQCGDEWLAPHRRRYRERQTGLLIELARRSASQRDFEAAAGYARRALELDPWREDGLRAIMTARASAGDRAGALEEFARFSQMLGLELGVTPTRETIELSEAIARESLPLEQKTNLPVLLTPIVGRDDELAAIRQLFKESRLLTLAGMGGIGKTALALTAARAAEVRGARAAFVDFGPLADGSLVEQTVALALGLKGAAGSAALANALGSGSTLLLFDTCEHVRDEAAALAAALLGAAPNLTILATSREPLGSPGEFVYRVPPLATPPAHALLAHEAGRYGAVALFCVRARAADATFALADANAQAVAELCRRLDGIPLAIELAASRASLFTPAQMLARLDQRLRLLGRIGSRQRTMREAIEWSYALLSPVEQRVFRRLSIFEAAFGIDAAGAIARAAGEDAWDVFNTVESLVSKSLVNTVQTGDERRFAVLETLRQFAREKLEAEGEADDAARALIGHYLGFARELRRQREQRTTRDEIGRALAREFANLRVALDLALREGKDLCAGAELISISVSHLRRHAVQEAREWCDLALAALPALDAPVAARLMIRRATVSANAAERERYALSALEATRAVGDPRDIADALQQVFFSKLKLGDVAGSEAAAREALALRRQSGTPPEIALALDNLAASLFNSRKLEEARACLEDAQRLDSNTISLRLMHLAEMAFAMGDVDEALRHGREAIPAVRAFEDRLNLALALCNLAAYEIRAGAPAKAREQLREALAVAREEEVEAHLAIVVQYLAEVGCSDGDFETAAHLFGWADRYFRDHSLGRETTEQWMYDCTARRLRERFEALELESLLDVGRRFSAVHATREAERVAARGRLATAGSA